MFTLLTVGFALLAVFLFGWTAAILITKKDPQNLIKEELRNMFEITKMLFLSIKSLIKLLIKSSFLPKPDNPTSEKSGGIDEQLLSFVPPVSDKKEENKAA